MVLTSRNRVTTDDAQVDGHIVPGAARVSGSVAEVLVDGNRYTVIRRRETYEDLVAAEMFRENLG